MGTVISIITFLTILLSVVLGQNSRINVLSPTRRPNNSTQQLKKELYQTSESTKEKFRAKSDDSTINPTINLPSSNGQESLFDTKFYKSYEKFSTTELPPSVFNITAPVAHNTTTTTICSVEVLPRWVFIGSLLIGGMLFGFVLGACCATCYHKFSSNKMFFSGDEKEPMLMKHNNLFKSDLKKTLQDRKKSQEKFHNNVNVPMSPAYPSPSSACSQKSEFSKKSQKDQKKNRMANDTESARHSN